MPGIRMLCIVPTSIALAFSISAASASAKNVFIKDSSLDAKARVVYFDRNYDDTSKDREQGGLGLELNYRSGYIRDVIGVDVSVYHVQKLSVSGNETNDVLSLTNNGDIDTSTSKIGQAYLKLKYADKVTAKLGRQKVKTLLLSSSSSRAVPNTFQGASVGLVLGEFNFYGLAFDKWSRRHDDHFEGFSTDTSNEGDIDLVSIFGARYQKSGFVAELEQLRSEDYLKKLGVRAGYSWKQPEYGQFKFTSGYFTSKDDGDLFVTGSEGGDLDDEDVSGAIVGTTPSDNDGEGYYVELVWKRERLTLAATYAEFDDLWIEDNFSGDHGTNPFPTRARGPDFTNANENVWHGRVSYSWNRFIKGLSTTLKYSRGKGATNTADSALGKADEDYTTFDVKWKIPYVKGAKFRWIHQAYNSDEDGRVDGVKGGLDQNRVYIDYIHKF